MPWEVLTEVYNKVLSSTTGRPALSARVVVGALIIKHMLNLTDEETIAQIRENPYLQYFWGYPCYSYDHKFEPSLFVTIRKRLDEESIEELNEMFINHTKRPSPRGKISKDRPHSSSGDDKDQVDIAQESVENNGMLLIDATVAPSDIKYPTDLDLLNQAREESERLIDALYEPSPEEAESEQEGSTSRNQVTAWLHCSKRSNDTTSA